MGLIGGPNGSSTLPLDQRCRRSRASFVLSDAGRSVLGRDGGVSLIVSNAPQTVQNTRWLSGDTSAATRRGGIMARPAIHASPFVLATLCYCALTRRDDPLLLFEPGAVSFQADGPGAWLARFPRRLCGVPPWKFLNRPLRRVRGCALHARLLTHCKFRWSVPHRASVLHCVCAFVPLWSSLVDQSSQPRTDIRSDRSCVRFEMLFKP